MKKVLSFSIVIFFMLTLTVRANIFEEIARTCSEPNRLGMVMWMPVQLFDAMAEELPKGAIEELREMLKGHTMLAVADGRVTALGRMTFQDETEIRKGLALIHKGKTYKAISAKDTPEAVRHFQDEIQRVWASMMGELGSNMRLYLFPVELDAAAKGEFKIKLGGGNTKETLFDFETPLRAVVPDSPCAGCQYSVRSAWKFCPRCGRKSEK